MGVVWRVGPGRKSKRPGVSSGPFSKNDLAAVISDETCVLEGRVGTVLVDGLDGLGAQGKAHEAIQLGHPDALGLKVRSDLALHDLGDVATDTALFLGETGTVDFAAGTDSASSDAADSGHGRKRGCLRGAGRMAG